MKPFEINDLLKVNELYKNRTNSTVQKINPFEWENVDDLVFYTYDKIYIVIEYDKYNDIVLYCVDNNYYCRVEKRCFMYYEKI